MSNPNEPYHNAGAIWAFLIIAVMMIGTLGGLGALAWVGLTCLGY